MNSSPPPFDPSKPYTIGGAATPPPFDPTKPFTREGDPKPAASPSLGERIGSGIKTKWDDFIKDWHEFLKTPQPIGGQQAFEKGMSLGLGFGPANLAVSRAAAPALSAGKVAAAQRLADFQTTGVTPNVPAVGQGRVSGLAANVGRTLPFSPVERGIRTNVAETQAAAERLANQMGQPLSTADAGSVAMNAIKRFAADTTQSDRDFNRFFALMQGAPPVKVTNTVATLQKLMGQFPSAKGLEGLFTSPPIARLRQELEPRKVNIPAKTSPVLSSSGQPIVTTPATTVTRGGLLTVPELKRLRTQIGYLLNQNRFGPEQIPKAELRRLYGALSKDMEDAATARGRPAIQALRQANFNYAARMKLIDELEPLAKDPPESVFRKLNSAAEDRNAGLLVTAKKVLTPSEWGQMGASVVQRLGQPTPGTVNLAQGTPFSISRYVTNWSKLSDQAKDILFGPAGYNPRNGLDALARVASDMKNVEKLANVSHSGEFVNVARTVETVFAALAAGQFPWATAAGIGSAYGAAKFMMSPKFTTWLYSLPNATARAATKQQAVDAAGESLKRVLLAASPSVVPTPPPSPYSDTMRAAAQPVPQQP